IHMNCLDRIGRRTVTVQSDGETFDLDMVAGTIRTGASRREFAADRDASFAAMHQALMRGSDDVCTLDEGAAGVEVIAAGGGSPGRTAMGHEGVEVRRLCTICARGGSKGLPNKNIRPLLGKPLLAHTIGQARASGLFERIAVSSDSAEILALADASGVDDAIE